jgi:hypothetical protein
MSGKRSPHAQIKLASLQVLLDRVHHVHGMVERFAATRDPRKAEMLAMPLKRAFGKLKLDLMGAGFDSMSQLAGSMEIAAGRGGSQRTKIRVLREGVGSLRFQVEHEQRKIVTDDEAEQRRAESKEEAADETGAGPG